MRFSSQFVVPIVSMVVASVISLCAVLFLLTGIQDKMEAERQAQAAALILKAKIDIIKMTAKDYSYWDDAVRNVSLRWNEEWLTENYDSSAFDSFGYEYMLIMDTGGRTRYAMVDGRRSQIAHAPTELGSGFERGLRLLQSNKFARPVAGVTKTRRGPAVFSVSWITPDSDTSLPITADRVVVMVKLIDTAVLTEMRDAVVGAASANAPEVSLADDRWLLAEFGTKNTLPLPWSASHPGTELFNRFLPWIMLLSSALIAFGGFVLVKARKATRELVATETRTRHLASHDALTGLPNRRAFIDYLIALSREKADYAILYLDLDGFKPVNDCFGHSTGDVILKMSGERVQQILPRDAQLSRIGGDEFAVVVRCGQLTPSLEALASGIVEAVRQPHEFGTGLIEVGTSIGIASNDSCEYEEVIRRADIAMYAAKAEGRNCWKLFDETLNSGQQERKLLETEIKRAIVEGEIGVAFQPIVRNQDGKVITVEALARWNHPQRGIIEPEIFISVAEESGAIVELGWTVMRQACQAARHWPCKLAINLSPAQFCQSNFVEKTLAVLAECRFPTDRLEFEITENYLLKSPDIAVEVIASLRRHGITITLDDFGTGYASIGYLRRFELDLVKLDRSFVENVAINADAANVALAIIALGTALKLPVVAEGVENPAQATILSMAGCSLMQGWHYGRPVGASEITAMLSDADSRHRAA